MPAPCPDCGAPVAEHNVLCPTCGYVLRPESFAGAKPPGSGSPGPSLPKRIILTILGLAFSFAGGAIGMKYVILPEVREASTHGSEEDGAGPLRQLWELEQRYHDRTQTYTADLEALGWKDPAVHHYSFRVAEATPDRFCLEAEPMPGIRGIPQHPLSLNSDGHLFYQGGCTGEMDPRGSIPLYVAP